MIATLRSVATAALAALIALQVAWYGWLAPPVRVPVGAAIALACIAFVPVAVAWIRDRRRGLFWGGVVALPYFCHGVMEAWAAPGVRVLAGIEIALSVLAILAVGAAGLAERRARAG